MCYKRINQSIVEIKTKDSKNYKSNINTFVRKRKMDFTDYIWYLTMQKGRTTSMELDEYLKNKNGTYEISISKQAFSKQRQNLNPQIFIDIYKDYLLDFYSNYPEEVKTYKGFYVCAIDGSLFEIPNTKELREEYKTQKNSSGNRESARARVSGIYDVENGFMLDALIKDCENGEKELAKKNIENTSKILNLENCIIIFDRGYPGIDLIWYLEKLKIKYIFRLQTKMYEQEKASMKTNDEWIELKVARDRLRKISNKEIKEELKKQKTLKVRMSKVILDTGEIEYLLSNISEEIILPEEMKEAYFKRWQIEIGYDILKNKLHLENFTGKTKITIEQDFYAQIYTFNVLQDIKNTNTRRIQEKQLNKNLKYKYKVNINILAGWLKNILIAVIFAEDGDEKEKLYNIIVEKAEKNLVAIKPNRTNIRKPYTSGRNKYRTNLRNNM
ncbi:MAG: IS4 family transposase [Clostridia bacterium]|nr:IS4 family transposase [Clostridia bacterium]